MTYDPRKYYNPGEGYCYEEPEHCLEVACSNLVWDDGLYCIDHYRKHKCSDCHLEQITPLIEDYCVDCAEQFANGDDDPEGFWRANIKAVREHGRLATEDEMKEQRAA